MKNSTNINFTLEQFYEGVDIPENAVVEFPNGDEAHARILKRNDEDSGFAYYGILIEENGNGSLAITIKTPRITAEEFMAGGFLGEKTEVISGLSKESFPGSSPKLYDLYQAVSDFGAENQFTGDELRRLVRFSKQHQESLKSLKTDSIEGCVKIFYPSLRSKDWKWDPLFKDKFQRIFHFTSEDLDKYIKDNQRETVVIPDLEFYSFA